MQRSHITTTVTTGTLSDAYVMGTIANAKVTHTTTVTTGTLSDAYFYRMLTAKAAYPTIGIAAFVMFDIVYLVGCLPFFGS